MSDLVLIKRETLEGIADMTRGMSGSGKKMSPEDIIYWLGRVKYIPQGWASSEFDLDALFESSAVGELVTN